MVVVSLSSVGAEVLLGEESDQRLMMIADIVQFAAGHSSAKGHNYVKTI